MVRAHIRQRLCHRQRQPGSGGYRRKHVDGSGSSFTFVLSDAEQAYDYRFITFRDRDRHREDSIEP